MSDGTGRTREDERRSSTPEGEPARHVMDPVERTVRTVLAAGIALSVALLAIGLALAAGAGDGIPHVIVPVPELARGLVALDAAAYLSAGLIVLIATPFVRVAGAILAFAAARDLRYVAVTALVLAVMCLSVLLGRA